jgi:hypothetical protein
VLGIPAVVNPLTDTTGEDCDQRQVDSVWFLADSNSPTPVVRACEVPTGKSLFFPLINNFYGAFLNDPPLNFTLSFDSSFFQHYARNPRLDWPNLPMLGKTAARSVFPTPNQDARVAPY